MMEYTTQIQISPSSKGPDKKNTHENDGPKKHPGPILVMKVSLENGR